MGKNMKKKMLQMTSIGSCKNCEIYDEVEVVGAVPLQVAVVEALELAMAPVAPKLEMKKRSPSLLDASLPCASRPL